jgi:hypothetical protein
VGGKSLLELASQKKAPVTIVTFWFLEGFAAQLEYRMKATDFMEHQWFEYDLGVPDVVNSQIRRSCPAWLPPGGLAPGSNMVYSDMLYQTARNDAGRLDPRSLINKHIE